jgi:hypothetical protein
MERMDFDKLELKIKGNIEISYGANMDEIASKLQKFTEKYLYIDDSLTLKFVEKITDLPYENCRCIGKKNHGFLLYEEKTDRVVQVFDQYLSMYLTGEIEIPVPKSEETTESEETDFDSISTGYESEEKLSTESTESESNESESSESSESESSESESSESESSESESSESTELVNKENFAEMIKKIFLSSYSSHFRIYFRSVLDNDYINAVFVNRQLFQQIENENEIDLEKTFNLSFATYLKCQGYDDVNIKIEFFNDLFAEIVIDSKKKLTEETITEIEENAMLNINTNDIIFFIHRDDISIEDIPNFSSNEDISENISEEKEKVHEVKEKVDVVEEKVEEKEIGEFEDSYEDTVYAREVPLARLPADLTNLVLRKTHQALFYNETISFYYQNHEFVLKNEGLGFYSLFDKDLVFYISHLHPDFYPNAYEYQDLPIAQFYF